jgi:hypothetical protein
MSPTIPFVPTLTRVLAEPLPHGLDESSVNGQPKRPGTTVLCPGCWQPITPDEIVDSQWERDEEPIPPWTPPPEVSLRGALRPPREHWPVWHPGHAPGG